MNLWRNQARPTLKSLLLGSGKRGNPSLASRLEIHCDLYILLHENNYKSLKLFNYYRSCTEDHKILGGKEHLQNVWNRTEKSLGENAEVSRS